MRGDVLLRRWLPIGWSRIGMLSQEQSSHWCPFRGLEVQIWCFSISQNLKFLKKKKSILEIKGIKFNIYWFIDRFTDRTLGDGTVGYRLWTRITRRTWGRRSRGGWTAPYKRGSKRCSPRWRPKAEHPKNASLQFYR